MNRVKVLAVIRLSSCATLLPMVWFASIGTLLFDPAADHRAYAITFDIEYTPEGENPSWDPDGSILTAHVQAAAAIWKNIFRGPEEYEFDYHWDDDIDGLGLTTHLGPVDVFMEINPNPPNFNWFADPTPNDNSEFDFSGQRVSYFDLSFADKSTYFPSFFSPPDELEVRYRGFGSPSFPSASGIPLVNAQNGYDLLSTIVHEMGHVLGVVGDEPGNYNIDPQHIGGKEGVTVLEGSGGHLGGNGDVPGFLMCDSCGAPGRRRLPTATDALVIAEDQGLQFVFLPRVDWINSHGAWDIADQWIGGRIPDATQDVFIRHFSSVTVIASNARARNLFVDSGIAVATIDVWPTSSLLVDGVVKIDGPTTLKIWSGASLEVGSLQIDPAALVTEVGTLVRFNDFTRGASSATSASFAGSVAIGNYSTNPVTFDPDSITAWNVADHLNIGDTRNATLVVNEGTWTVGKYVQVGDSGGRLIIQGSGVMNIGSNLVVQGLSSSESETVIESGGTLNVVGTVFISNYGKMKYQNSTSAADATHEIIGGATGVKQSPIYPYPYIIEHTPGGSLTFDGTATAASAAINIEGGKGMDAPSASATFKGNSTAGDAEIRNKGGRKGPASPIGYFKAGFGGQTHFEDHALAGSAHIYNEPVLDGEFGTGGWTVFGESSSADHVIVENRGSTYVAGEGGVTQFSDTATADWGTFTNFAGSVYINNFGAGRAVFFDQTTAADATLINEAGDFNLRRGGETHFREESNAGRAKIFNRAGPSIYGKSTTRFFDDTSAADAKITHNSGGLGGLTEFNDNSNAGSATFIFETGTRTPGSNSAGQVTFNDISTAENSHFQVRPYLSGPIIRFYDQSSAGDATFVLEDNSSDYTASIAFLGNSSSGTADFSIGNHNELAFLDDSTAPNTDITIRSGGIGIAKGHSTPGGNPTVSLGISQIRVLGANAPPPGTSSGGSFQLEQFATADEATITVEGGTVNGALGGVFRLLQGRLGHAKLILNGGVPGAFGGTARFDQGGKEKDARIIANAGGTVSIVNFAEQYGDTEIGSIEGAGKIEISGHAHLVIGSRNVDTTLSGAITAAPSYGSGGRLTKVGTGSLTLAGANTYTGVTTIDGGTLAVNGSITSSAIVNNGGMLKGTGIVGGAVTVNSGGVLAPGSSPGTITVASLAMMPGSTLDVELGTTYDRVLVNGAVSLDGTLNASFVSGFTPAAGNSFDFFDWTSKTGAFSSLNLAALPSGLMWNTSQLYAAGVLSIAAVPPGDFNIDGEVNASDYIIWRKGLGTAFNQNDYNTWRTHFGQTAGSGSALPSAEMLSAAVPEPAGVALLVLGAATLSVCRTRRITGLLIVCAMTSLATTAQAASYTVTDLGALGGTENLPWGINSSGQVTGYATTTNEETVKAFLWNPTTPNGASGAIYDLGTLGGTYSWGTGINAHGQVAGVSATTDDAAEHATLWNPTAPNGASGMLYDLGTLGGPFSQANAANVSGQVTGYSDTAADGISNAFLWNPAAPNGPTGTMYDIGSLGGSFAIGWDINLNGQVTGDSNTLNDEASHAFLWNPTATGGTSGVMDDLGTLGGTDSGASKINNGGQVVGWSDVTGDEDAHAFLWTPTLPGGISGSMLDLGTLGGANSYGIGLTTDGRVVGASDVEPEVSNNTHAFLYSASGGMFDLNALIDPLSGWELLDAVDVNDAGQITGQGLINDEYHAFLLTPTPIPGDFNHNGIVDAADYVVWRNGLGTLYSQSHYATWQSHFGQTAGSGTALPSAEPLSAAVPEPATLVMLVLAAAGACSRRSRAA